MDSLRRLVSNLSTPGADVDAKVLSDYEDNGEAEFHDTSDAESPEQPPVMNGVADLPEDMAPAKLDSLVNGGEERGPADVADINEYDNDSEDSYTSLEEPGPLQPDAATEIISDAAVIAVVAPVEISVVEEQTENVSEALVPEAQLQELDSQDDTEKALPAPTVETTVDEPNLVSEFIAITESVKVSEIDTKQNEENDSNAQDEEKIGSNEDELINEIPEKGYFIDVASPQLVSEGLPPLGITEDVGVSNVEGEAEVSVGVDAEDKGLTVAEGEPQPEAEAELKAEVEALVEAEAEPEVGIEVDGMEIDEDVFAEIIDEDDDDDGAEEEPIPPEQAERLHKAFLSALSGQEPKAEQPANDSPASSAPLGLSSGLGLPPRGTRTAPSGGSSNPPRAATEARSAVTPAVEEDPQLRATKEKVMAVRVKLLRLANRLGQSYQNSVVSQVLYRLDLAENMRSAFRPVMMPGLSGPSLEQARSKAEELEEKEGPDSELDFECTILALGKTGTGKSATINSLFDKKCANVDAFTPATTKVQEIFGKIHGIKVRVIDTPGLHPSIYDMRKNQSILKSVKGFCKKRSPDIMLYFDRLDMHSRDYSDIPLLRMISETFGPGVWLNALVVLTHGAAAPPEGINGQPISYEVYMGQRSHVIQQTIRQAAGDMRLITPVSMAENHPACRTNRQGEKVLPNGQVWKPQLLLVCFASKLLSEANSYLKPAEIPGMRSMQSAMKPRFAPLPFLLSGLLQSRAPLKLPEDQMGDEDEDDDLFDEDDEEDEEEEEVMDFKRLSRDEVDALTPESRRDYFEALSDFERSYQRKQFREEMRRRREMKRRRTLNPQDGENKEQAEAEEEAPQSTTVNVPMPDMVLPPSFDSDNPSYRYRFLDGGDQQWVMRPMLQENGWDHDSGYDSVEINKSFVVKNKIPAMITSQITKEKNQGNINLEAAASYRHGDSQGANPVTTAGFEVQSLGKDMAYTLRSDTRFNNFRRNKTAGGLSFTMVGKTLASGMKIEDRLLVGKCLKFVFQGGVITGKKDVGYGGSLEATLRHRDYPLERAMAVLGLSVMDWQGDLALGANLQSQFQLGKTLMATRVNLNNRGSGQITVRATSSEQLYMALLGVVPLLRAVGLKLFRGPSSMMMDGMEE